MLSVWKPFHDHLLPKLTQGQTYKGAGASLRCSGMGRFNLWLIVVPIDNSQPIGAILGDHFPHNTIAILVQIWLVVQVLECSGVILSTCNSPHIRGSRHIPGRGVYQQQKGVYQAGEIMLLIVPPNNKLLSDLFVFTFPGILVCFMWFSDFDPYSMCPFCSRLQRLPVSDHAQVVTFSGEMSHDWTSLKIEDGRYIEIHRDT